MKRRGARLWALVAYAVLALLVSLGLAQLGFWQLHRADEKQQLIDSIDAAGSQAAIDLAIAIEGKQELRFRVVTAHGRFLADHQILLDNQIRDGVSGVQAFVPLRLDSGESTVLVDRGWLPWPDRRAPLPQVPVSGEPLAQDGLLLSAPAAGLALGAELAQQWPLLVTRIDIKDLEHRLQLPLLDLVLEDRATPRAHSLRAGMLPPERHRGYALQWFGLSLTVLIIFGVLVTRTWRAGRSTLS